MSYIDELDRLEHLMNDPVKNHERIMQMLRPSMPRVVHKEYSGKQLPLRIVADKGEEQLPSLIDDQMMDAVAAVIVEMKNDLRNEFESQVENTIGSLAEQVAVMQGQMSVLMNLISGIVNNNGNAGGNGTKSIEASETRTTRRVRVRRTSESNTP